MRHVEIIGPYLSEFGTWRYAIECDGRIRWGSLRTKDERIARARLAKIREGYAKAGIVVKKTA